VGTLEAEVHALHNQLQQMQAADGKHRAAMRDLETTADGKARRIRDVEAEVAGKSNRIAELEGHTQAVELRLSEVRNLLASSERACMELEEALGASRRQGNELSDELQRKERHVQELETDVAALSTKCKSQNAEFNALREQLYEAQDSAEKKGAQIRELGMRLHETEGQLSVVQRRLRDWTEEERHALQNKAMLSEESREALARKVTELEIDLAGKARIAKALELELDERALDLNKIRQQVRQDEEDA
jgi:chromosome segregation ATPase